MERSRRAPARLLVSSLAWAAWFVLPLAAHSQTAPSVRRIHVLGDRNPVEIEIESSDQIVPEIQVLTGPDRLVVDFPNTYPAAELRNLTLHGGDVKSVRVGRFGSKPPVTRVVFDLNGPQAYGVFPAGRNTIVKIGTRNPQSATFSPSSSGAKLVTTNYSIQSVQITPPPQPSPLTVSFQSGLLSIHATKANLSEVLFAIHQRTGADIAIPAGAEQEQVVAEIGPGPAPEVVSSLLNGSNFNFLILSAAGNSGRLDRVILSPRPDGPAPAYRPLPQVAVAAEETPEEVPARTPPPPAPAPNPNPGTDRQGLPNPETRAPSDSVPD